MKNMVHICHILVFNEVGGDSFKPMFYAPTSVASVDFTISRLFTPAQ